MKLTDDLLTLDDLARLSGKTKRRVSDTLYRACPAEVPVIAGRRLVPRSYLPTLLELLNAPRRRPGPKPKTGGTAGV